MAVKRFPPMALLAFSAALAACQSASTERQEGQDLTFVQEMMREAAELEQSPKRTERAVQAVEAWRGENE